MTRKNTDNVCSIRRKTNLSTHRDFRTHPDQFNIPTQQADTVLLCSSQIIIRYTTMCINIPPKYSKYIIPNVILTKPQLKLQFYKHTIMIPYSRLYMISINTIAVHYISTLFTHSAHHLPISNFRCKAVHIIICETDAADFTSNNNHTLPNTTRNYTNKTYSQ